ncbi:MAG: hypothetical protein GY943_18460 [Chloroflexi bacterium]|nr:hypothetical protein [Chloroflexota bacterium]
MQTTIESSQTPAKTNTLDTILIGTGIIFILTAIGLLFIFISQPKPTLATNGNAPLNATDAPIQINLRGANANPFEMNSAGKLWTITPQATYQISARVLGNKSYLDWQSPIVPRDFALGWGEMSDPAVDEWINWRQSGRWYYYNWTGDSPYKRNDIRNQSANVHLIPATENLELALQAVNKGDVVYLEGMLVNIETVTNGRSMSARSSLTRKDSGSGACEIFYINKLIIDEEVFE